MDFIWDIETFPNCFQLCIKAVGDGPRWQYEISSRRHEAKEIIALCHWLAAGGHRMVGFNNVGFDYPVLHMLLMQGDASVEQLYTKAMNIIGGDRFAHMVWQNERRVQQMDLYLIHHFDNKARATSLKTLEFNMGMRNIEDLPFPVGTVLTPGQMDVLAEYCWNDIEATEAFYNESQDMIRFREELSLKYGTDYLNHSDVKLGKDYLLRELKAAGVECYEYGPEGRKPRQTLREVIKLGEVIFPWIRFETPELQALLEQLRGTEIAETKQVFKNMSVTIDDFTFHFGTGGLHGSVDNLVVQANDELWIWDVDVTSYYPSLAIVNRLYPEHLGEKFVDIYASLREQRVNHPKGSAENAMLKLALNGVFGDSNNPYSPFFDPYFAMGITLNGQLLLVQLAERLMLGDDPVDMLQANTDGLTFMLHPGNEVQTQLILDLWQFETGLELEQVNYDRMFIRDVNNYVAEYQS